MTLNQEADTKAVALRARLKQRQYYPKQAPTHGENSILVINGERVVHDTQDQMRLSLSWPRLHTHWDKTRTAHANLNKIAYAALGHAMEQCTQTRRIWVVLIVHGNTALECRGNLVKARLDRGMITNPTDISPLIGMTMRRQGPQGNGWR